MAKMGKQKKVKEEGNATNMRAKLKDDKKSCYSLIYNIEELYFQ